MGASTSLDESAPIDPRSSLEGTTTDPVGSSAQRERRQRILDATIALATEGGFDAVQMRAVAERADVALGTLYRYFPSKIHLLVSALGREFDRAQVAWASRTIPGGTPADRVVHVLRRTSRGLGDRHLTEALTRAFMFADSSAQVEIEKVGIALTKMLTHAMYPDQRDVTDDDMTVARVIGDVWLSALVAWVTGRSSDEETARHMDRAVRMILR